MTPPATLRPAEEIFYPEDDGLPMADTTIQFRWITVLSGNLAARYSARKDVLVGGNLLWYAREGDVNERTAPDVYVVFGRPKGDRGSYRQWEEGGVPMTVVFEIVSPSNGPTELAKKLIFYDEYGVEEYYIYDPDTNELTVYLRGRAALVLQPKAKEFVSPRLGIRFDLSGPEMMVYHPDGRPFLTFEDLHAEAAREREQRLGAEHDAEQARSDAEQARIDAGNLRAALTRMRQLSRKARLQQATPEELLELERLEEANGGPSG